MRITSYSIDGIKSFGVVTDDGVIDAKPLAGGPQSLKEAIAAGSMDMIAEAAVKRSADHSIDEVEFLPVIPDPDKIIAVGLNYRSHVLEGGRDIGLPTGQLGILESWAEGPPVDQTETI